MKKTILFLMSAVAMMMTACDSDTTLVGEATESDETVVSDDPQESGSTTVRFKFSSGTVSSRADDEDDELQSAEEKAVSSLIAVIFYDNDEGVTASWETQTHADADVYYKYYTIDGISESSPLEEGTTYSFTIGKEGYFQICFVANAPEELIDGLDALVSGTSTLADFKAIEVTQDPATKPMTMTSTFYGIISEELLSLGDDDAATVSMNRIMARIDVITDSSEYLIITGITLKNRTTTSVIYNDDITTLNTDYIGDDYTATGLTLQYDADATDTSAYYYSEKIYSYENFATASSAYVPTLLLTYTFEGYESRKYQHEVKFVQDVNGVSTAINLKRNYRYLVQVGYDGENGITSAITVVDWDSGEIFFVTTDDLKDGYDN